MNAGEFLAEGADTCVYDPHLLCAYFSFGSFQKYGTHYSDHVSRIVEQDSKEIEVQRTLKEILPENVMAHFTFYTEACKSFVFRPEDYQKKSTGDKCTLYPVLKRPTKPVVITSTAGLMNLVTPRLGPTLKVSMQTMPEKTKRGLMDLIRMLFTLRGEYFVYFDAHEGNIAWNASQTKLTLFDFGWTRLTTSGFLQYCNRVLDPKEAAYFSNYKQFRFGVLAVRFCNERGVSFMYLKPIFDVLAILGTLYYESIYNESSDTWNLAIHSSPLFSNISDCVDQLIDAAISGASVDTFHLICNRTIFKPLLPKSPQFSYSPVSAISTPSPNGRSPNLPGPAERYRSPDGETTNCIVT
jgi:hypothetical protein